MNRLFFESGLTKLFEIDVESLVSKTINELPEKPREIHVLSVTNYWNSETYSSLFKTQKSTFINQMVDLSLEYLDRKK